MIDPLQLPRPDRDHLVDKLLTLRIHGRPLNTTRNLACALCGGSVLPLGRLAWPGAPLCNRSTCELVSSGRVTELFQTPYGRAMTTGILRIFCRTLEKDRALVQLNPIRERAPELIDGYLDLLHWQRCFDTFDRLSNTDIYRRGGITLVPPRRLDDVLVFRAFDKPIKRDPTEFLPPETGLSLRRIYRDGPEALAMPF